MANPSGAKGARGEKAVADFLKRWWPYCERRVRNGAVDRGDISGTPHTWEVKSVVKSGYEIPAWLKETEVERVNAKTRWGFLVIKPRGVAEANVDKFWCVMPLEQAARLVALADTAAPRL